MEFGERKTFFRSKMKKFIDCLNRAEIFEEKIPYLVIHRKEKFFSSKLELNVTFRENISKLIVNNNEKEQIEKYIIDKLNKNQNFTVKKSSNSVFLKVIDNSDVKYNKKFLVAYYFDFSNIFSKKDINKCLMSIEIYNKYIPMFELISNVEV